MNEFLKQELLKKISSPEYYIFEYSEHKNNDALTDAWLENRTSYIYKVAVMTAIDWNKCDFAHIVIGTQRNENAKPELKGYLYFDRGENDDMGRVIERAFKLLQYIHPAFEPR
jgi:hypothetical protein